MDKRDTVDIHCHILPGIDDGAVDMDQALEMLRLAWADGTSAMILTPHYRDNSKQEALFEALCRRAKEEMPDMELYLGNELLYHHETVTDLESGRAKPLNGSQYCLLEFGANVWKSQVEMAVSDILCNGWTPIVAHAERYAIFRTDPNLLDEILNMGALIQLNADSVAGKHGLRTKWFCRRLLKARKVHFIASDAHDTQKRPPLLGACRQMIGKKIDPSYADRLFCDNPRAVLENRTI